ncbi:MAG: 4-(cytidine 5'-diphospho)-2-C-methyl-D-erythritol kinase [Candidatus Hydrothermae bacterium]|nr:4-(cytidine 5'-diphospho)-2-C-methyl-D-erythritol kinase [Candidatus Hydrothermae bacterium]
MKLLATLHSPAKVNLGLWITGRRNDGYHNLVTVFHRIAFHDTIKIWDGEKFAVKCTDCPDDEGNILFNVKELFENRFNIEINFYIEIFKEIPPGSGLGGASSNAATFIQFLNEHFKLGLDRKELIELGSRVGADVPFFLLEEDACIATGIGDILEPIDSNMNFPLYLYIPDVRISTVWAYNKIDELNLHIPHKEALEKAMRISRALQENDLEALYPLENTFEKVVFAEYPEIREAKENLYILGAKVASLSGSGSSVFGIFERFLTIHGEENLVESRLGGKVG